MSSYSISNNASVEAASDDLPLPYNDEEDERLIKEFDTISLPLNKDESIMTPDSNNLNEPVFEINFDNEDYLSDGDPTQTGLSSAEKNIDVNISESNIDLDQQSSKSNLDANDLQNNESLLSATNDKFRFKNDSDYDDRIEERSLCNKNTQSGSSSTEQMKSLSVRPTSSDEFVKRGTYLRTLIKSTLSKILAASTRLDNEDEKDSDSKSKRKMFSPNISSKSKRYKETKNADQRHKAKSKTKREEYDLHYANELAREKSAACSISEKKLQEAQSRTASLETQLSKEQNSHQQASTKLLKTQSALRIAGASAAAARANADASNARAQHLLKQLSQMQSCIAETARDCNNLKKEHDEIAQIARAVQEELLSSKAELKRCRKMYSKLKEEYTALTSELNEGRQNHFHAQEQLELTQQQLREQNQTSLEQKEMENSRKRRTLQLHEELNQARSLLTQATNSTAESESTIAVLKDTIQELKTENEKMHRTVNETMEQCERDAKKKDEALLLVETEAQKLRIKSATEEDELRRLRLDKSESEKYVEQLKSKVAALEKRLNAVGDQEAKYGRRDISSFGTGTNSAASNGSYSTASSNTSLRTGREPSRNDDARSTSSTSLGRSVHAHRPVRPQDDSRSTATNNNGDQLQEKESRLNYYDNSSSNGNGNGNAKTASARSKPSPARSKASHKNGPACVFCTKKAYGLMKSCQCGRTPPCETRAHSSCVVAKSKELCLDSASSFCHVIP